MILNVSGRTDVVAFYTKWFMKRIEEGFFDVRNPFNPKLVNRIKFSNVDLILFCTKNPIPIVNKIEKINIPIIFQVTLTPYKREVEPNVPPKGQVIDAIKKISKIVGKENMYIRYDPIFLSDKYNLEYHIKAFDNLCKKLNGYTNHFIVSFIDEYKNIKKNINILKYREFTSYDYEMIGKSFSKSAKENGMTVQTCFETNDLTYYGFIKNDCITHDLVFKLTGKTGFKKWSARKEKKCNCVEMVDVGVYNSCLHFCKYCYANYDEDKVKENYKLHNPNSSLLIGELNSDDIIKERIK